MSADVESAKQHAVRLLDLYWSSGVDGVAEDIVVLIRERDAAIRAQARAEALREAADMVASADYLHEYVELEERFRQLAERTERDG